MSGNIPNPAPELPAAGPGLVFLLTWGHCPGGPALGHPLSPGAGWHLGSGGLTPGLGKRAVPAEAGFWAQGQPLAQRPLRGHLQVL